LRRALTGLSREFGKINVDTLTEECRTIWRNSEEENLRPMDGSGLRGAGTPGAEEAAGPRGTTALDRFAQDLTAKAASGEMDPILGRDEEIRQIIDVLMRRRPEQPDPHRRGRPSARPPWWRASPSASRLARFRRRCAA